jgi:hypothetical protein
VSYSLIWILLWWQHYFLHYHHRKPHFSLSQFAFSHFFPLFFISIYLFLIFYCAGGTLWHFTKVLQFIKCNQIDCTWIHPSIILLFPPPPFLE